MTAKKGPKDWTPKFSDVQDARRQECLVVLAPEWFAREDFQFWRRVSGVATWAEPTVEGQDVFVVYADGDLDWHTQDLPRDIRKKLQMLVSEHDIGYGVIWIKAV